MNKNTQKLLKLNDINISNNSSFILIAGPCAIESKDHALEIASNINIICKELNIKFIYKSSFDKANRSSINSMRGVGLNEALKIFEYLKKQFLKLLSFSISRGIAFLLLSRSSFVLLIISSHAIFTLLL